MSTISSRTLLLLCLFFALNSNKAKANLNLNFDNVTPGAVTQYEKKRNQGVEQQIKQQKLEDEYFKEGEEIKLPSNKINDEREFIEFEIKKIEIIGNKIVSKKELEKPFENILNRKIAFDELQNAIDQANKIYSEQGYITSSLIIPPQELGSEGVLKLEAIEGRIGEIKVVNDKRLSESFIRQYIRPKKGQIFDLNQLENSLSRLNRKGHFRIIAKVAPSQKPNASDLILEVSETANLVQLMPQINNQGRPNIGILRSGASVVFYSPLGRADTLTINAMGANKTALGGINYVVPINTHGTYLGAGYDIGAIRTNFQGSRLSGASQIASNYIGQEIVNKDNLQINAELGWQLKESETKFAGQEILDTPVRNLFQRVTWNEVDKLGSSFGFLQLSEGLNVFGGRSEFLVVNGELNRIQRFIDLGKVIKNVQPSYFLFRAGGQMTSRGLPAIEQYQIGGLRTIRGYQEGALIGDIGQFSSLEYHFPLPMPTDKWNLDKRFELVGFIDQGSIKSFEGGWHSRNFLLGAGTGLRAHLTESLGVQMDIGFPLANKLSSGSPADARVHFSVFMATPTFGKPWKKEAKTNKK